MTDFRIIPTTDAYPGLTGLRLTDTREVVAADTGPDVEQALSDWAKQALIAMENDTRDPS